MRRQHVSVVRLDSSVTFWILPGEHNALFPSFQSALPAATAARPPLSVLPARNVRMTWRARIQEDCRALLNALTRVERPNLRTGRSEGCFDREAPVIEPELRRDAVCAGEYAPLYLHGNRSHGTRRIAEAQVPFHRMAFP